MKTPEQQQDIDRLTRRAERERHSRQQAEKLLESKSRELYLANQSLVESSNTLEERVQQRTEEIEQQTRELQVLIKERERFTANVTHELRTPLQGILGFASLGESRCANATPEKLEKWFKTIHLSGETLLALVNNLLDIAKLDANMMDIVHQNFTVNDLFQDVNNEFALRFKEKNIRLELNAVNDIMLEADQFRMGQVFRNLIGNALKFCDKSTTIELQALEHKSTIELRVINKGPRIPGTEAKTIFDSFVESSSTRGNSGGTGLGLAICKHIIEAHHGDIHLDTSHTSTCFVVEIPKTKRGVFSDAA